MSRADRKSLLNPHKLNNTRLVGLNGDVFHPANRADLIPTSYTD